MLQESGTGLVVPRCSHPAWLPHSLPILYGCGDNSVRAGTDKFLLCLPDSSMQQTCTADCSETRQHMSTPMYMPGSYPLLLLVAENIDI